MLPTIMSRGPIDLWTRTPRFIAPFSASAPSHHNLSSGDFITNIAESSFQYTQVVIVLGQITAWLSSKLHARTC
jgi:hypothetical protein